jgi:hypothetical protein
MTFPEWEVGQTKGCRGMDTRTKDCPASVIQTKDCRDMGTRAIGLQEAGAAVLTILCLSRLLQGW